MPNTFLHDHDLPAADVPLIDFANPAATRADLDSFFASKGQYSQLAVHPRDDPNACRELGPLLATWTHKQGIALVGRSGAGKTVAAVSAFRHLHAEYHRNPRKGRPVRPVWLQPTANSKDEREKPWDLFRQWVTHSVAHERAAERDWLRLMEDWLRYSPARLVFFAKLPADATHAGALVRTLVAAQEWFKNAEIDHTCVALLRPDVPAPTDFAQFEVARPGHPFRDHMGIGVGAWDTLRARFGDDLTPFVAAAARGSSDDDLPTVGGLLRRVCEGVLHRHLYRLGTLEVRGRGHLLRGYATVVRPPARRLRRAIARGGVWRSATDPRV